MPRRSHPQKPEQLQKALLAQLETFSEELKKGDLRASVVSLVPVFHTLRDLGSSLVPEAGARDRILAYLREYPQENIDGDELMVVSGINEWPRRVRELRTEEGWPISTKNTGREELPVGAYVLEEDRQAYEHDRKIPDPVRVAVLKRDHYSCVKCGWNRSMLCPGDPRKTLELHHVKHHKDGGANTPENLVTLCNVCHDEVHRPS